MIVKVMRTSLTGRSLYIFQRIPDDEKATWLSARILPWGTCCHVAFAEACLTAMQAD